MSASSAGGAPADLRRDRVGPLFDWYGNGDVEIAPGDLERPFRVTRASADWLAESWSRIGVDVIGRRLFDLTNGWNGRPAVGDHVFVVTHSAPTDWPFPDAPFTFVTVGLRSAIDQARELAGDRDISLTAGDLAGQALAEGLVDEISIDLVPVVFGSGVRFFGSYPGPYALLENPDMVIRGDCVTHLHYRVRRS